VLDCPVYGDMQLTGTAQHFITKLLTPYHIIFSHSVDP